MTITFTILAEDADELIQTMRQFTSAVPVKPAALKAPSPSVGSSPTEITPPPVEDKPIKPKRRRRTNSEIEADKLRGERDQEKTGHDRVRELLSQIEAKHGAAGIAKASGLMKAKLDEQGGPYDKVRVSNVEEPFIWSLVTNLEESLAEDLDE